MKTDSPSEPNTINSSTAEMKSFLFVFFVLNFPIELDEA